MLRQSLMILLLGFSLNSAAGQFDYLPSGEGAANEFKNMMNSGNYKSALMAWSSSHASSAFGNSSSGQATLAYLMYQNGMPLAGLDLLLSTNPNSLDSQLFTLWNTELKNSIWIQKGWMQTTGGWKRLHNNEAVSLKIKNKNDIKKAFAKANAAGRDANYKARILWQIVTLAPQLNDVDSALKALKILKESGQTAIGTDYVSSAYARVLYQKGDIEAALQAFHEIPKSSSLWVESVEERAWAHLRRGDYDKATSETVTMLSSALDPLIGPESYFLANLVALKICDYPRIFKNSEQFKSRQKNRLSMMQELAKTGVNKSINAAFERLDQKGVSIEGAGPLVDSLPRAVFRDQKFVRFMETRRQWLSEGKRATELLGAGNALGSSERLVRLSNEARPIADKLKQLAFQRVRVLANAEMKEFKQNINKMHIIEGEVIQRLAVDDSLKGERSKLAKADDTGDVLVFPYSSDEVWFDELDNYKARVKDCPSLKGAGL